MNKSLLVSVFLAAGLISGAAAALIAGPPETKQPIEWLENPRNLPGFSLEKEAGGFNNQSLKGYWTIVMFGFLNCPDICPTSLAQLATLADHLAELTTDNEVNYVFVSVDPNRDTPTQISQYVTNFNSSIQGVTGTEEQLEQFASALGIQFKVSADTDNYRVSHSITYSMIDREGVFRGRFRPGFDVTGWVESFKPYLSQ